MMKIRNAATGAILLAVILTAGGCGSGGEAAGQAPQSEAVQAEASQAEAAPETVSEAESGSSAEDDAAYAASIIASLSDVEIPTTTQTTQSATPDAESEEEPIAPQEVTPEIVSSEAATPDGGADGSASSQGVHILTSSDNSFELTAPESWSDLSSEMSVLGDTAMAFPLKIGSMDEEVFLIGTRELKSGGVFATHEDFHEAVLAYVCASDSPLTEISSGGTISHTLSRSGCTAFKTALSGRYSGISVAYYVYSVETEDAYYELCAWTSAERSNELGSTIDAVLDTFTEHTAVQ